MVTIRTTLISCNIKVMHQHNIIYILHLLLQLYFDANTFIIRLNSWMNAGVFVHCSISTFTAVSQTKRFVVEAE